jgi:hypothetical protein
LIICLTVSEAKVTPVLKQQSLQPSNNGGLVFVENHGQWDSQAKFLAASNGVNAWITKSGVVYDFYRIEKGVIPSEFPDDPYLDQDIFTSMIKGHVVNMTFVGINDPQIQGNDKQKGYYNYIVGNDPTQWASYVPLFKEATATNLYDGVNARYYYDKSGFRYDLIVTPNGNPGQIHFKLEGAYNYQINESGDLEISTSIGSISQAKLFAYQLVDGAKIQVQCAFKIDNNGIIGFEVGKYDNSLPLIIDPLIYSTYLGGSNFDAAYSATIDAEGNHFVGGGTMSTNYPITPGAYQTVFSGSFNSIITKLNTTGSDLIYSTYLGGNVYDMTYGIVVDGEGNALLTGYAQSPNFPTTPGVFGPIHNGSMDAYVTKLNSDGSALIFSSLLGGSGYDAAQGIVVDADGNIYFGGFTGSSTIPTTPGVFQPVYAGGTYDGFICKINSDATAILACTYIGSMSGETQAQIAIDKNGYIYAAGYTAGTDFPVTTGAFQTTYGGGTNDGYCFKMNSTLTTMVYCTYLGGSADDQMRFLVVDTTGNAYIVGSTKSANYPVTPGAFQTVYGGGGNNDGIVTKLNAAGNALVYSTYLGGSMVDNTRCIAITNTGEAFVTGSTTSYDFPVTPDAYMISYTGTQDAILAKLNPDGTNLEYSTYIGGTGTDGGGLINYDGNGNVYMTANVYTADFPTTPGAFSNTYGGGGQPDIIMMKWQFSLPIPLAQPVLMSPINNSTNISINPTLGWQEVTNATYYSVQVATDNLFTNLVVDNANVPATSLAVNNLNHLTTYYWRVMAHNPVNQSNWSDVWSFTTEVLMTVPWVVTENTGNSSTIVVPTSINPTINGRAFTAGDAIGFFYQKPTNEWGCGGYGLWTGSNLQITVWGDNPTTTIKDGFTVGEAYTVKVWDGQALAQYDANVTYSIGPDNYQVDAFSMMGSLDVIISRTQTFNLPGGWSMISSNINPFSPNLNIVFGPVVSNVIIVKNGFGLNYIPGYNINQIGNWNVLDGYLIKLILPTQFSFDGIAVMPENTPIPLNATWNLISYLRTASMPVASALTNLGNTIIIVKNGLGQMYVPSYNINQIGNMNPGEGYYINVNTAENLIYPANASLRAIVGEDRISPSPKHLIPTNVRTGSDASFILNINAADGDEIGIYNTSNELIGSGVVDNGTAAITIWGDDATTEAIEGATEGEILSAKLFDLQSGTYQNIILSNIHEAIRNNKLDQLSYTKDALFTAQANVSDGTGLILAVSNSPNPFGDITTINYSLPADGTVELKIYNVQGELVSTLFNGYRIAGNFEVTFRSGNLPSGAYNMVLELNGEKATKMMMMVK